MQRYMVTNKELKLDDTDINHIINVMRMKQNDKFQIVYDNVLYTCNITNIEKRKVDYEIIKKEEIKSNKTHKVIIACSLIKEQKMDFLLQKATELGVDEIIPIISERTVVKIDKKNTNKISRWIKICKEASEQSHRMNILKIHEIINLKGLSDVKANAKIVCNTNEMSKNIKKVLQDVKKSDTMIIVVGPEGGFSDNEINYLLENGFISTTLGENILRAETVPLYILSVINYEFLR